MKRISYKEQVINAASNAFQKAVEHYGEKNKEVIDSPRSWPGSWGTTYRKSGEVVVGGFRNIVDLGNLKDSQKINFVNPFLATIEWDGKGETPTPLVHEGYTTSTGKQVPARPWTRYALLESNIELVFKENFTY